MDLVPRGCLSPCDHTFNFWNDYLGLSTLVAPANRPRSPVACGGPDSISESLRARLNSDESPDELGERISLLRRRPLARLGPARDGGDALGSPVVCPDAPEAPEARGRCKRAPRGKPEARLCVFCRNNGAPEEVYASHILKTADGRVLCPVLRAYTCPLCSANGDNAHTVKYCPLFACRAPPGGGHDGLLLAGGGRTPGGRLQLFS
ncbi:nanos homolog 1-like [Syngnathoides biaculeatus]|uniref:nanos homolog 1-like n=1 Tax=Syngnathoides biaculeatus TaxID=300417 RepID=UPI002ADD7AFD|nr:nanos homolog 1-like [Syngnathoides biaculeatus]